MQTKMAAQSVTAPQVQRTWFQTKRAKYTEALELQYTPVPKPSAGEILVKVHSVALNHEWKIMPVFPWPLRRFPVIPELECSGWVVDPNGHSEFQEGEEVIGVLPMWGKGSHISGGRGTLAEYILMPVDMAVKKPKSMSFEEAAGLSGIGVTAYTYIHILAHLQSGQKIFISGGSTGCGWMLIQMAKAVGAHITASCSAAKFEQLKGFGADVLLDYKSSPITKQLIDSGTQFDVIFDCLGDQPLYQACPNFLAPSGQFWSLTPDVGDFSSFSSFLRKSASVAANFWLPVWAGGVPRHYQFHSTNIKRAEMEKVVQLYESGHVRMLVDSVHPSDKTGVMKAYDRVSSMRANGKVIISMITS